MAVEDLFTPVLGSEQLCLEDMMSLGMIVQPVLDDDDDEFSLCRVEPVLPFVMAVYSPFSQASWTIEIVCRATSGTLNHGGMASVPGIIRSFPSYDLIMSTIEALM